MDINQLLNRIQWRQQSNEKGEPTDLGLVSSSRLLKFITPLHTRKKVGELYEIRTEWLGHQSTKSGSDTFRIEHENLAKIGEMVVESSEKQAIVKNLTDDEQL